ncbi:AAA family ATPase [Aster yellows witches'-broom phytoplasma]|nr:AAA family ATPase [Aster yellows witches'-broom phytoplasma]
MKQALFFIDEIDSFVIDRNDFSQQEKGNNIKWMVFKSGDNENTFIVIVATNRVEALDYALLRPGRFNYVVNILLPDLKAQKAILELFAKGKNIADAASRKKRKRNYCY